jgi:hypothetical protein
MTVVINYDNIIIALCETTQVLEAPKDLAKYQLQHKKVFFLALFAAFPKGTIVLFTFLTSITEKYTYWEFCLKLCKNNWLQSYDEMLIILKPLEKENCFKKIDYPTAVKQKREVAHEFLSQKKFKDSSKIYNSLLKIDYPALRAQWVCNKSRQALGKT